MLSIYQASMKKFEKIDLTLNLTASEDLQEVRYISVITDKQARA